MIRLEIKKLQYDINIEVAKISPSLFEKTDKYEYLTGKKISSDQTKVIEQAKFTYSPLGKAL